MHSHNIKRVLCYLGFSFRQFWGLEGVYVIQKKLDFQFPQTLVKPDMSPGGLRLYRVLGQLKPLIQGSCFASKVCAGFLGGS